MLLLNKRNLNAPTIIIEKQNKKGFFEKCSEYFDLDTKQTKTLLITGSLVVVIALAVLTALGPEKLV